MVSRQLTTWQRYLLGGAAAVVVYWLVADGWTRVAVFDAIGLSACVAIVFGVLRYRPARRAPWLFFAAGIGLNVGGNFVENWLVRVQQNENWPSIADGFYIAIFPGFLIGLLLITKARTKSGDRESLVDAAIITTGLGLLSWVFVLSPIAHEETTIISRLVSFAYPVGDILVLAIVVRMLASAGVRNAAFYLMSASLMLFLVGDVSWAIINYVHVEAGQTLSNVLDSVFLLAYLAFGASALTPSMAAVDAPGEHASARLGRGRLGALMVATLVAPGVLIFEVWRGDVSDGLAIALCSVALFTLVTGRMAMLLRQLEGQAGQLRVLARVDSLTGVSNRRVLDQELPAELERSLRSGEPVSVAMLDLDRFKGYNDRHGHKAGDHLLKSAIAVWQSQLRVVDHLIRYGGDEFVIVLPSSDLAASTEVARRLHASTPLGETVSIGVAMWDGVETPDELVHRADAALYSAKDAGRDRVFAAGELLVSTSPVAP